MKSYLCAQPRNDDPRRLLLRCPTVIRMRGLLWRCRLNARLSSRPPQHIRAAGYRDRSAVEQSFEDSYPRPAQRGISKRGGVDLFGVRERQEIAGSSDLGKV